MYRSLRYVGAGELRMLAIALSLHCDDAARTVNEYIFDLRVPVFNRDHAQL